MEEREENQKQLIKQGENVLLRNYRQQPVVFVRGDGMYLYDAAGKSYLDMTAGIAVCSLGHNHPELRRTVADQAGLLLHTSNLYYVEQQIEAATAITERCFATRVFFCNSGAEANEAALKLARHYQHGIAKQERNTVISTKGSFHGRTIATLAITGQEKYRSGFGPLFGPVEFVEYGNLEASRAVLEKKEACCFIVEPIQGEGGVVVPPDGYLSGLREICDETGTLLIFDEIQTGVGRTGRWFAHQWEGVEPDVMTLAKGLGGGVAVGAIATTDRAAQGLDFVPGGPVLHASTFGGNPLACAAATTVLETIEAEGLLENTVMAGEYLRLRLQTLVDGFENCLEVRGRGLLCGIRVESDAAAIVGACRERGLLLSVAGGTVLRFAPALITKRAHVDEAVEILGLVLKEQ